MIFHIDGKTICAEPNADPSAGMKSRDGRTLINSEANPNRREYEIFKAFQRERGEHRLDAGTLDAGTDVERISGSSRKHNSKMGQYRWHYSIWGRRGRRHR
jgi:hypothetical protein